MLRKTVKKLLNEFMRDITSLGGATFFGFLVVVSLSLMKWHLSSLLVIGFIISFIITLGIRLIYHKDRPKKEVYSNIIEKIDASSFPSLHSARAIFLALVFIFIEHNLIYQLLIATISLTIIYSRIHLKKHDVNDVIGGIILGGVTYWFSKEILTFFFLTL